MIPQPHVLVIDDDVSFRKLMVYQIRKIGYTTVEADDVKTALKILELEEIQLVLTDVQLPDGNGVALVKVIKALHPLIEVIAITSLGKIADGVLAIKNGAFDYIQKDADQLRLIPLLMAAAEKVALQKTLLRLNEQVESAVAKSGEDIIAQNREQIDKAALIIKAISSPLRQTIMHLLFTKGKANVTEIYTQLNLEQPIASQHLALLKEAGLVNSERSGKSIFYSANYTGTEKIIAFIHQLLGTDATK